RREYDAPGARSKFYYDDHKSSFLCDRCIGYFRLSLRNISASINSHSGAELDSRIVTSYKNSQFFIGQSGCTSSANPTLVTNSCDRIISTEYITFLGEDMPNEGLKELYVDELKDLYSAENQLVKALPKMAKAAASEELKAGFEEHLEQTKGHVQRLEQIFEMLDESPKGKKCKGMEGLIEEGSEIIEEDFEDALLDSALIGAAQRVEHYEIAAYGTVRA